MAYTANTLELFDGTPSLAAPVARRPVSFALMAATHKHILAPQDSDSITAIPAPLSLKPEDFTDIEGGGGSNAPSSKPGTPTTRQTKTSNWQLLTHIYIPTFQTIISPTIALRVPTMIADLGLLQTILVAACATLLTLSTALSFSAFGSGIWSRSQESTGTSTTTKKSKKPKPPKHGGIYFMISRNLGKVIGGSVSCIFYFGVLMGVAVLVNAFSKMMVSLQAVQSISTDVSEENLKRVFGTLFMVTAALLRPFSRKVAGSSVHSISVASVICFVVAVVGLLCAGVGLVIYAAEKGPVKAQDNFNFNWAHGSIPTLEMFFQMFGFFIPAVSGVLSGTSRSAELKNPRKDIPRFTIAAQVTTSLIYFFFILLLGVAMDRDTLQINQLPELSQDSSSILVALGWPIKWISLAGFIAICLGSAIQGLGSAMKLLQSLANDDVLPILRVFKKVPSENRVDRMWNTWKGRFLGFFVIEFTILVGDADHICHVFAVLYLMIYVFLNASIAALGLMKSPSWRPTWKYHHWSLSATTSIVSLVFAFFINVVASYDARSQYGRSNNNTGGIALLLQIAKKNLWEVEAKGCDCNTCDWRPHVLAVVDGSRDEDGVWSVSETNKLEFLSQMKKGGGLSMVLNVQKDWDDVMDTHEANLGIRKGLQMEISKYGLKAFLQVIFADTFNSGVLSAIQCSGLGPLRPNTIMLEWPQKMTRSFIHLLRGIVVLDKAVLLVKGLNSGTEPLQITDTSRQKTIDIFWVMLDGAILTLIAHILMKHAAWQSCKFRIFVIAQPTDDVSDMKERLQNNLRGLGIHAEADVLVLEHQDAVAKCAIGVTGLTKCLEAQGTSSVDNESPELNKVFGKTTRSSSNEVEKGKVPRRSTVFSLRTVSDLCKDSPVELTSSETLAESCVALAKDLSLQRLGLAIKLNALIKSKLRDSKLVLCNLPCPEQVTNDVEEYIEFLKRFADGLEHVVFVRGTGNEVVSDFY
ncbi:amino acid permease-domain-containing protein [Obelidium mucronatum]|nr:amino acid permease-domain-containing protein [Obelidium mucronatum]